MRAHAPSVSVPAAPPRALDAVLPQRAILLLATVVALAGASTLGQPVEAEPDLVRLMRFMALIKGAFAAVALAACLWRLGRPVAGWWRAAAYGLAPALMAGGAAALWRLAWPGAASLGLHLGLLALLAAALTDRDFIPWPRSRTT
ncbi:MAG TPA: hypothetical protein VGN94_02560 [Methylobacterium sp.]|nr:hypothetical protein [Methylobacterium sp.]